MQGRLSNATAAAERIVLHARRARDQRLVSRSLVPISYALVHGPEPVGEALGRCEELLASVQGDRKTEAIIHGAVAQLLAMREEFDEARAHYRRLQAILAELGSGIDTHSTSLESGRVEMLAGDLEAAARELRRDDGALAELGESYLRSTIAALLGEVLRLLGDLEGADRFTTIATELAADDDVEAQVIWRSTRARLLAGAGAVDEALSLVQSAVTMVGPTEETSLRADALLALADVLAAANERDAAQAALENALRVVEAKGDRARAGRVSARLGSAAEAPAGQ